MKKWRLFAYKNIIILYNPYYQENVIEQHLDILKQNGAVAFGKVKSKLNDTQHPNEQQLEHIYSEVSKETPLQLFLTDYNSIFVAGSIISKPSILHTRKRLYPLTIKIKKLF